MNNAYGNASKLDAARYTAQNLPEVALFLRTLWTDTLGRRQAVALTLDDGSSDAYTFLILDGFTQGNAASSFGYCLAQARALEQAWQAIDSLGLTDQLQLWAYHDDLVVRIATKHFTAIFDELRKLGSLYSR